MKLTVFGFRKHVALLARLLESAASYGGPGCSVLLVGPGMHAAVALELTALPALRVVPPAEPSKHFPNVLRATAVRARIIFRPGSTRVTRLRFTHCLLLMSPLFFLLFLGLPIVPFHIEDFLRRQGAVVDPPGDGLIIPDRPLDLAGLFRECLELIISGVLTIWFERRVGYL